MQFRGYLTTLETAGFMMQLKKRLITRLRASVAYRLGLVDAGQLVEKLDAGQLSQPLWKRLHALSLAGMNIGGSHQFADSGELWVLEYINKHLNAERVATVFDVGANIGDYTLQVVSRLGKTRVYCFEPGHKAFELLCANLSHYPNVELHNFGLSDKEDRVKLFYDTEASALASVYKRRLEHFNISMGRSEEVHLKSLDEFCAGKGIRHIDLLKLDVEGHELKVFQGAFKLLSSHAIDFIQFEFGGCNIDSRTFLQDFFYYLQPYYKIFRILRNGLAPLETYDERIEIFVYSNFLAVSRKVRQIPYASH